MTEHFQQYIGTGLSLHLWKEHAENVLREQIYNAFMKEGIYSGYAQHVVQLSSPIQNVAAKND
jgi:hypothetical protein